MPSSTSHNDTISYPKAKKTTIAFSWPIATSLWPNATPLGLPLWPRELGIFLRGESIVAFELAREVAGVRVPEIKGCLADVPAVSEELHGLLHSQVLEPVAGFAANRSLEETFEHTHGDTARTRQRRHGVVGLVGELGPVLDTGQGGARNELLDQWINGLMGD
jgi:hypothetical protein